MSSSPERDSKYDEKDIGGPLTQTLSAEHYGGQAVYHADELTDEVIIHEEETTTHRALKARHVSMIAIGE